MPTGTGKSLVLAEIIRRVMQGWPGQRVMLLTHVAKLLEQDAKAIYGQWENAPLGFHSAELGLKDYIQPIILGGVQSV